MSDRKRQSSTAVLHIATPEGVTFALPLAGPVTRALAVFVDAAVIALIQKIVTVAVTVITVLQQDLGGAANYIFGFVITFGYTTISELLFGGQTLGKKVMRIRVVDERGMRLKPTQVVVRNLLRLVDMFPIYYAVGGVFALFSKRCQRLGDLAAGTVVVRLIKATAPDVESVLGGKYNSFRSCPHLEARLRQKTTPEEAQLALAALVRREELETDAALTLFEEMAVRFREKVKFPDEAEFGLSDEQYVRNAVDSLYRRANTLETRKARH
jgi:uncharacterized RDD family membrane protein YckC